MPETIYQLLPRLMARVGAIPKERRNPQQHYRYRSIDDIQAALHPALCELGMASSVRAHDVQTGHTTETKPRGSGDRQIYRSHLLLDVTLFAPDGSNVTFCGAGEGIDYSGDKATNKAMVAAYKYAVTLGLCIPVELEDSDREAPPQPQPQAAKLTPKPLDNTGTDPHSIGADDPCPQTDQDEIKRLASELSIDAYGLKAIVQKRGVQWLGQLSSEQAQDLIGRLKQKRLEQEAAAVF